MPTMSPMFRPRLLDPLAVPGRRRTAPDGGVEACPKAPRRHAVVVGRWSTRYGGACVLTAATTLPLVGAGKRRATADVDWSSRRVDFDTGVVDGVQISTSSSSSTSCSPEFTATTFSACDVREDRVSGSTLDSARCGDAATSPDDLDSLQSESSSSSFHVAVQLTSSPEPTDALTTSLPFGSLRA